MNGWPMRRIVIAGGGTAGWMTAAALGRELGPLADVTLVESDAIGTVGVGESTIPPIITFNNLLGINEAEFMQATQATFKLGIEFDNWGQDGDRYFHSFGTTGKDHWTAGFQHFWLEGVKRGHHEPYDAYCLELNAAHASRFAHLPDNGCNYAYQLDATLYARFLRGLAEKGGVKRQEGKIATVEKDSASGDIAALVLDSGAADRRRLLHRLHRISRAAHRRRNGQQVRGLDSLVAVQPGDCRPDRRGWSAGPLHPRHCP